MDIKVRVIQPQEEEINPVDISDYEKEMLLAKYGYLNQPSCTIDSPSDLDTFEDMIKKSGHSTPPPIINGPKPITFDGKYDSNIVYGSDPDSGLNFKINIVSDMKIPKNGY